MGTLMYGNPGITATFDDRALVHLQIVITAKLRRRESFLFSWSDSAAEGSGHSSIWLDPTSVLYFRFLGGRSPSINRSWLAVLEASANAGTGLVYSAEPRGPELSSAG
ncbi:hypothetical protein GCM10025867_00860 [Frondihabitans sucicola]|uniref:DUF7882 domain-containing protein n=1 Tax=Frondihabitans sucicola TaxID=1268041 RepID=A0ABN6XS94_9MICO|nr:ATP-dependent DNA ligase [Frondihabitans sucicola]BDZ47845.1 hypothetical protein GCM10025867_00860 [Frondihabitans sucicola]